MHVTDLGWRKDALCQEREPEEFVAETRAKKVAQRVCAHCPVASQCLETALTSPWEPYGIWAGLSRKELLPEWRRRRDAGDHESISSYVGVA